MKQIKIYDIDNEEYHGAILLDTGDAICGCCGSILPADELNETWKIAKEYPRWKDLTNEICGKDWDDE